MMLVALALTVPGVVSSPAGIETVVKMLKDMSAKAVRAKNDEKVAYAKSSTVCETETSRMEKAVSEAKERINVLKADIEKKTSEAKGLAEDVEGLSASIDKTTSDLELKVKARQEAYETFQKESKDLSESVDQLTRAHQTLKSAAHHKAGTASLQQLAAEGSLAPKVREVLTALTGTSAYASTDEQDLALLTRAMEPGVADAYKHQSGGIIEVLEQMRDKTDEELKTLRTTESKAKHDEELVIQELEISIKNAKKTKAEKLESKTKRDAQVAFGEKQLASVKEDKRDSEKLLEETSSECKEASDEFKEDQATREEEIEALAEATKLIESSEVSTAKKHLDLAQMASWGTTALIQLSAEKKIIPAALPTHRVRVYLKEQARRLKSKSLALVAEKMVAQPFNKVTRMIKGMLDRLESEAKEDATKEETCDVERAKTKQTRTELTGEVDSLTSKIEEGTGTISMLDKEIKVLEGEIQEIDEARQESKSRRAEEKDKNADIIKESTAAAKAVKDAVAVLKTFYKKKAGEAEFIQEAASDPYGGLQSEAGGVLAMLEVVTSDFETAAAAAKKAEEKSKKRHDEFMTQSKTSKETKEKNLQLRKDDKTTEEAELTKSEAELKSTSKELEAANKYAEKLEGQCEDAGTTYKERAAARQAEIQSLKEALQIL